MDTLQSSAFADLPVMELAITSAKGVKSKPLASFECGQNQNPTPPEWTAAYRRERPEAAQLQAESEQFMSAYDARQETV